MKKIFLLLCATLAIDSHAQITAESLNETYARVRTVIQSGELEQLEGITNEFITANPDAQHVLSESITEEYFLEVRNYIEGTATTEDSVNNLVTNIGMVGMAGPQVSYFLQEAGIENRRVGGMLSILGFAIKHGIISDITVPAESRPDYVVQALSAVIAASEVSQWQGNHTDSYNFTAPEKLVPVYAVMADAFGANYSLEHLDQNTQELLQARTLGPVESWQQPLDIIGEVVRRSHHAQNPLYEKIDTRDYFFFIQDHYARVFGATDVNDAVELTVGVQESTRLVLLVCNASSARLTPGVSADSGNSVLMTSIVIPWDNFSQSRSYTCGQKTYDVNVDDVRLEASAPEPTIVRINDDHIENGFNVVLSYIYFDDLPEEVVQNLINAMQEPDVGFTYAGETPITDSPAALQDAISNADMFYRIGHVQGNNLNISFTEGRELLFTKMHDYRGERVQINWRVQIPLTRPTDYTALTREQLSEALWNRKVNGKEQSLLAMGIACRSASYINTWMDAYFEAVMNHTNDLSIDASGRIQDFDPPFVMGATNTFDSGTHREDQSGLESFLRIILISMNHAIHPNPEFDTQDTLRRAMYHALANNDTPYMAESNHDQPHTREMSRRINIVLSHEDELIDRVFE